MRNAVVRGEQLEFLRATISFFNTAQGQLLPGDSALVANSITEKGKALGLGEMSQDSRRKVVNHVLDLANLRRACREFKSELFERRAVARATRLAYVPVEYL